MGEGAYLSSHFPPSVRLNSVLRTSEEKPTPRCRMCIRRGSGLQTDRRQVRPLSHLIVLLRSFRATSPAVLGLVGWMPLLRDNHPGAAVSSGEKDGVEGSLFFRLEGLSEFHGIQLEAPFLDDHIPAPELSEPAVEAFSLEGFVPQNFPDAGKGGFRETIRGEIGDLWVDLPCIDSFGQRSDESRPNDCRVRFIEIPVGEVRGMRPVRVVTGEAVPSRQDDRLAEGSLFEMAKEKNGFLALALVRDEHRFRVLWYLFARNAWGYLDG